MIVNIAVTMADNTDPQHVNKKQKKNSKIYCQVCEKEFTCDDYESHKKSKKHCIKERAFGNKKKSLRSIRVCYSPQQLNQNMILNHFGSFDVITNYEVIHFVQPPVMVITYRSKFMCDKVLRRNHRIKGVPVTVKPDLIEDSTRKRIDSDKMQLDQILLNKFKDATSDMASIDQQMFTFMEMFQEPDQLKKWKHEICSQIANLLCQHIPRGITLYPFGSSMNNCGFFDCDLDLFIQMHFPFDKDSEKVSKKGATQKSMPKMSLRQMTKMELESLHHVDLLRRIFDILIPWLRKFTVSFCCIPNCAVPIIKFTHIESNVSCDINIRNGCGVRNSNVIRFYTSYDKRFRPLAMVFRYWFKTTKLKGLITNYAVTMLVLFFLQSGPNPVLPTIQDVLLHLDYKFRDPCESDLFRPVESIPHLDNDCPPSLLLVKIFEFYGSFDFEANVICLLDATVADKSTFASPNFKNKDMATQDPFEKDRNITSLVKADVVAHFKKLAIKAHEKLIKHRQNNELWGLPLLLTGNDEDLVLSKQLKRFFIKKNITDSDEQSWMLNFRAKIMYFLQDLMLFEVSDVEEPSSKELSEGDANVKNENEHNSDDEITNVNVSHTSSQESLSEIDQPETSENTDAAMNSLSAEDSESNLSQPSSQINTELLDEASKPVDDEDVESSDIACPIQPNLSPNGLELASASSKPTDSNEDVETSVMPDVGDPLMMSLSSEIGPESAGDNEAVECSESSEKEMLDVGSTLLSKLSSVESKPSIIAAAKISKSESKYQICRVNCKAYLNTWMNRPNKKKLKNAGYKTDGTIVGNAIAAAEDYRKLLPSLVSKKPLANFTFQCSAKNGVNEKVQVHIQNCGSNASIFTDLSTFLSTMSPQIINLLNVK